MKHLFTFAVVLFFIGGCFEGPMGPEGPQGDPGIQGPTGPTGPTGPQGPGSFYTLTGVLSASTLIDNLYWDKGTSVIEDFTLVQPYTRIGAGYLWVEPEIWAISYLNRYVRFFLSNSTIEIGHEYLIVLCTPDKKEKMEEYVRGLNEEVNKYLRE